MLWGSERYGPFGNMFESVHLRNGNDASRVTCFCQYCKKTAATRGIDVARALKGYKELERRVGFCRGGGIPPDGHYVTFWRVLFQYPEILAWETYITSASKTIYGDMPIDDALEFEHRIMGCRGRSYTELPYVGLDPSYVYTRPSAVLRMWKGQRPRSCPVSTLTSPT